MPCSSCHAEMLPGERYCAACGYDSAKDDHIEVYLAPRLRKARGWILAVGIIYLVSALIFTLAYGDRVDPSYRTQLLATNGGLFLVHLGLWWWARSAAFAAAVVALCLFATVQLVDAILDPTSLTRGIIIKALFLFALIQAVRAGLEVQRLRRERG